MKNIAYYNGTVGELADMVVPFCDRVCFFGDGVYDATYARNGKVFTLDEHLARLFRSAEAVGIEPPLPFNELRSLVLSLVERAEKVCSFVYIQFTRGISMPRNHLFGDGKSSLWVSITPKEITPRERTFALCSYPDKRYGYCSVKTLNLLPNVLASLNAAQKGCDESVFIEDGIAHECAHSNVHILQNGVLLSPPAGEKVLGGIARTLLLAACRTLGVPVEERFFTVEELLAADEVYVTSAGTLLTPCHSFDGKKVGGKGRDVTHLLQDALYGEFYAATD